MISSRLLLITLLTSEIISANPVTKEKKVGKKARKDGAGGGRNGNCSKEECDAGLEKFKLSTDCVRAPFCIRKVVRSMRKIDKEKTELVKHMKKDSDDMKKLQEENQQLVDRTQNNEWKDKYSGLHDDVQVMKSNEAKLRQINLGLEADNKAMEKRNQRLEDKFKDLKQKLEQIEKHSTSIITVNAEKEELQKALNHMEDKHKIQERRIGDIVKSLELIETQNALNSQNLSAVTKENLELKSALGVLEEQNNHLKTLEGQLLEDADSARKNFTECKDSIADLRDVNSNCKTKIRELNVCKSELSKLSSLVEDKLQMMEATKDSASNAKQRSDDLENDLKKAKSDIDRFSSSLEKKSRDVEELMSKLVVCETERRERKTVSEEESKILKNCESPCTISKNAVNDFITNEDNTKEENTLRVDNEILTKKVENLEVSLLECQGGEISDPEVNQTASESIIKDLLS